MGKNAPRVVHTRSGAGSTRSHFSHLASAKDQHRLTQLNFVAILQRPGLVFVNRLSVDLCAIRATLVAERVIAVPLADNRGVQARDGQIFQEDIAFAAAANAEGLFAHFVDSARLFAFFNAHDAHPTRSHAAHCHAC